MKHLRHSLLTLSLLANAVLGWLVWPSSPPSVVEAVSSVTAPLPAEPAAFEWRQLEAPDFATYIANLRRAGCPEATIRHLIEPELHAVFEARRQNTATHPSQPSSPADEAATLAALLDAPEAERPMADFSSAVSTPDSPFIPAAFLVGNAAGDATLQNGGLSITPTDDSLAPETLQTLAGMRRQFGDRVTSSSSDPSSREYYRQWLKAQRESDDYFASLYGGDHFIRVQQQANLLRSSAGVEDAAQVTKSSN